MSKEDVSIKRILFIGMSPNQGGIETFMMNIFLYLEGQNFHFDFLNIYKEGIAYSNDIINHGGNIYNVFIPNNIFGHLIRKHRIALFFLKHHTYDIVHVNAMSINALFWIEMANKFNINKLIIQSHVNNRQYKSLFERAISKLLAMKSRYYLDTHNNIIELSVNKSSGKWMFNNNKFHIIPNGINVKKFRFNRYYSNYYRRKLKIKPYEKVIITVARLSYQKNYFRIINIFKHICKLLNYAVKLVIIGDGPEKNKLIKLVKILHLDNNVIFLGSIKYVYKILSIANLMLMPSRYEGFPFCLIESQSEGVPALVSSEAIPKSSNITGTLEYISLKKSDNYWARKAVLLLNKHYNKKKMNECIKESPYNVITLIRCIKHVYLQ